MYVKPKEAARILGVSPATITRCKQMGAPVRYLGTCGRLYLVDPDAMGDWMNEQGQKQSGREQRLRAVSVAELRAARHRAG